MTPESTAEEQMKTYDEKTGLEIENPDLEKGFEEV